MLKTCTAAREWLLANTQFLGITAAVLVVTHLAQFQVRVSMLQKMKANPHLLWELGHFVHVLKTWCILFSGIFIMGNQKTIYHWDVGGSLHWYDILATMGQYVGMKFHLPSLNVAFSYTLGTVVAITGKLLPHSIDSVEVGDRVCFTWFFEKMFENI